MTRGLRARLDRLASSLAPPGECDGQPTVIVRAGGPVPDDAARCPRCGGVHDLCVTEVVVNSREEIAAVNAPDFDGSRLVRRLDGRLEVGPEDR